MEGNTPSKPKPVRIKIALLEDRVTVAGILVKNGYQVRPGKSKRTPTGKTYDYYLEVVEQTEDEK